MDRPDVHIAGFYGTYTGEDERPGWAAADQLFAQRHAEIRGRKGDGIYGFLYRPHRDHPELPEDLRVCFVGVEVDGPDGQAGGVAVTSFGGGWYATVTSSGDTSSEAAEGVGEGVALLTKWIPEHGWEPGKACFAMSREGSPTPPHVEHVYFELEGAPGSDAVHRRVLRYRDALRSGFPRLKKVVSDQRRGLPRGGLQKAIPEGAVVVNLPRPDRSVLRKPGIFDCIADRRSRRSFRPEPLSLEELSYLLWATQGVRKLRGSSITERTVPSGGAMHPLETYLAAHNVEGLARGLWRYQAVDHALVRLDGARGLASKVTRAAMGQGFVGDCAVTFIWSAVPYKTEWRYTTEARKLILQDTGHVAQNLYLACESIGCGTCSIGAYDQRKLDRLCGLDGRDEMVVYAAPVGRV